MQAVGIRALGIGTQHRNDLLFETIRGEFENTVDSQCISVSFRAVLRRPIPASIYKHRRAAGPGRTDVDLYRIREVRAPWAFESLRIHQAEVVVPANGGVRIRNPVVATPFEQRGISHGLT